MSNSVKFIAYADIHHDILGAKCVTLEDTLEVEKAIFRRAKEGGFDFILFAGDRMLRREPQDKVKVMADLVVYEGSHKGGVPYYALVGNHDQSDTAKTWHTLESLKIFDNVVVMDECKTYQFKNLVRLHALPADSKLDLSKYDIDPNYFNIFTFHDTVRGAIYNEGSNLSAESGLDSDSFDIPGFDLICAGDIHKKQLFNLKNTQGGYLGSVVQRTLADANVLKGWMEFNVIRRNINAPWSIDVTFVPTKNLFTRIKFGVDKNTEFKDLIFDEKDIINQFVEVKLVGNKSNVDRVADDPEWNKFQKKLKPRRVEILRSYETEQSQVVVDLSTSTGILDDLSLYLGSNFASLGNIKEERVADVVRRLKRQEGPIQ